MALANFLIGYQTQASTFPLAEIAGLFSEIVVLVFCMFKYVSNIHQIDLRVIFYTYLLYRHN